LALLLMLDLAQDGFLGTATFELPPAAAKTSISTLHHTGSGLSDIRLEVRPSNLSTHPCQVNYQAVDIRVQPTFNIIDFHNIRSSGGIPFEGSLSFPGFFSGLT
jgi:hypothetical protein